MLFPIAPSSPGIRRTMTAVAGVAALCAITHVAAADSATAMPGSGSNINLASASTSDSALLDDVVVTAERRAEPIQKVPTTVTAVSGNEVMALDLGSSAANITFLIADTSAGETAPTRPRWWIRGVGTGAQGFDVQSPVGVDWGKSSPVFIRPWWPE